MTTVKLAEGKLKMDVSSEDSHIPAGTSVVISSVVDNFKNMFIEVVSMRSKVRLNQYDTNIDWLV